MSAFFLVSCRYSVISSQIYIHSYNSCDSCSFNFKLYAINSNKKDYPKRRSLLLYNQVRGYRTTTLCVVFLMRTRYMPQGSAMLRCPSTTAV